MADWEFRFWAAVLGLFLFVSVIGYTGISAARGESTYTGYIVDTEINKGILFRTSTAHLKTHFRSSAHESFCLPTEELAQQAKQFQREEQKVRITYSRPLWVPPTKCDGGLSLIRDITPVDEN